MSQKGAIAENELLRLFHEKGFGCTRSAGSGHSANSPDLVVIKESKAIGIECKARKQSSLYMEWQQYEGLKEWQQRSKAELWVAWKLPRQGWFFFKLEEMHYTGKNYTITSELAIRHHRKLEDII